MSKRMRRMILAACLAAVLPPVFAAYSDLQVTTVGWTGPSITISVYNPNPGTEVARVRVAVILDNDTTEVLTSPNVSVGGYATKSVNLTASRPIVGISDEPEPFVPLY
jgi:hypothetical protein